MSEGTEYSALNSVMLEKSVYREIVKLSYSNGTSVSAIINDILKEYLHTYILSKKMGHMLVSRDIIKPAIDQMTQDQITTAAKMNANRYKEGVILENGKPSLAAYLRLMRSFSKANKFDFELTVNPENDSQVLLSQFKMGRNFSKYKSETYRLLLQDFVDVTNTELTDSMVFMEFRSKKEQAATEPAKAQQ